MVKKGDRIRYKYRDVERYRSWDVKGVGCVVKINNRRDLPIMVQPRNEQRAFWIKRGEIVKILKDNKLRPYEHPDFVHCGYQMCCY